MPRLITITEYEKLVADRPQKFSAEQVGYKDHTPRGQNEICSSCLHFYRGEVAERTVCEIFRPEGGKDVEALGFCLFWTLEGKRFPLLKPARVKTLVGDEEEEE